MGHHEEIVGEGGVVLNVEPLFDEKRQNREDQGRNDGFFQDFDR